MRHASNTTAGLSLLFLTRLVACFIPCPIRPVLPSRAFRETIDTGERETVPLKDSSPSCPFSKPFPRYRIELTSRKKQIQQQESIIPGFLQDIQSSWKKARFEKQYKHSQWLDRQSGVAAFASLWRWAATLVSSGENREVVLGFPDCDSLALMRWMDILDWWQQESGLMKDGVSGSRIQATLLENPTAMRLVCEGGVLGPTNYSGGSTIDSNVIERRMQAWVKRVLVDMSICPFTKSVTKSGQGLADVGVPVGRISYHASDASPNQIFQLMADTWEAIADMLDAGPSGRNGISSILLAAPNFDEYFDLWSGPVFAMLEAGVIAAGAEDKVGVVCFHPRYLTPDGSSFPGFGHMHSVPRLEKWVKEENSQSNMSTDLIAAGGAWQRRTPHATINVLRADQLEKAEGRRSSGKMYTENICKLVGDPDGVGLAKLERDLERERQMGMQ